MKLGFVTAILEDENFEQVVDFAAEQKFRCLETACWPVGKAERRYAGVTHIDVDTLDPKRAGEILAYCGEKGIEIATLAYYPNVLEADPVRREEIISHLKKVILAADRLGVGMVTTFIGRVQNATVEENLKVVAQVWPEILKAAEASNVRIAIENCPMLFGADQWPGGQNLFTSPANWDRIFEILPSEYLGITYDPSHFVWQMMDYIEPIYKYKDKIFHVHIKDIKLYPEKLKRTGTLAYPLEYMSPKLPGLGDVDWGKYMSALTDIGYDGYICLEIEDKAFEKTKKDVYNSLILSKRYIENFLID
ncbi:sugar phosphate isomerase/epimerase family protein [Clostridium sp. Marseille-P3244]|uniref:sugar phosphate isomerase/epimerase family protein n=1 Tax=Clostridium sp. Marseille-P3244 TaxID=1871020 RepID=UPI000931AF6F|nr:sugar phosphate isomerase/epimerase family protein [Clostridium sp. Marseille-P3244]